MVRGQALVTQFMQEDLLGMEEAKHTPPSPFITLSTAACNSKVLMKDPRRCLLWWRALLLQKINLLQIWG